MTAKKMNEMVALDKAAKKSGGYVADLSSSNLSAKAENDFHQIRKYCVSHKINMSALSEKQKDSILSK